MVMDVDRDESVSEGVATIVTEHDRLDAVIACAGWGLAGPVELTSIDEAKDQIETNFWGAVRVVRRGPSDHAPPGRRPGRSD